ncbi:unnamed protein product [Eruca vesicaria subsp. sativa]|uniref:F-box domain-containing protein n=1 Tax=Eruca vesicaria subsp. sativa TaxID=29727 RepID=A0ABC8LTK5_ERUVS|nr:unnamed protein product [Eruca vesicaria subsp. sativa]
MALGKKRTIAERSSSKHVEYGGLGFDLELVQYKRGFGRKRILVSSGADEIEDSFFTSPVRKISSGRSQELEDLPLDILVKIICGVEHEDLKQLFHVSKTIREAALIAKQTHFAYSTPRKTSVIHHDLNKPFGLGVVSDDEIKTPRAPLQKRYRLSRINCIKDISGVSVSLFN